MAVPSSMKHRCTLSSLSTLHVRHNPKYSPPLVSLMFTLAHPVVVNDIPPVIKAATKQQNANLAHIEDDAKSSFKVIFGDGIK